MPKASKPVTDSHKPRAATAKFGRSEWLVEFDVETARLIWEGVPPWDAVARAREIVSARRRRKSGR